MIKLTINSKKVIVDDKELYMDVVPFLQNQRTYVPVRFVAEGLGYNVDWNDKTREVTIYGRRKYFDTVEDCAYDWGMHFNAPSIALFKEFGSIIYESEKGYYWDKVKIGNDKEVYWDIQKVREGVAFIHSHSGGKPSLTDNMSQGDQYSAKKCQRPLYMVDSGGQLHVMNPLAENVRDRYQKKLRDGLPVDGKYVDITEAAENMKRYFNNNYHDLSDIDVGYICDYYNKMFMKGVNYANS